MINTEAARLAETITITWTTGPRRSVWYDVLQEDRYTAEASWAVYRKLRDNSQHAPSIAQFRELYRLHMGHESPEHLAPLPPVERCWSPQMYLEYLHQQAEAGDVGAADELARMDRVINRGVPIVRRLDDDANNKEHA